MNPVLELLMQNINNLIESSRLGKNINHAGLKGKIKEDRLKTFLLEYLPRKFQIGNGKIIDSNKSLSAETDLIIFDDESLPKSMLSESVGVFPIEICRYAFEIKSTLNAKELKTTIDKFNRLKDFNSRGEKKPLRVLFAFDSDLKSESEIDRIKKYDEDFHTNPAIQIILIANKGYWYHMKRETKFIESKQFAITSHYYESLSKQNYFEIALLLTGILNTLSPELPSFSAYMDDFGDFNDLKITNEVILELEENSDKIENANSDKLIVRHEIFCHENKSYWFKKPSKIKLLFNQKEFKTREPIIEINLINDGTENIYVENISVLTSRQLVFLLPISEIYGSLDTPLLIKPHQNKKIGTKFICFPKRNSEKQGGAFIAEKGGKYFWQHDYKFSNTDLKTYGVIEIETSSNQKFYSSEINLTRLEQNEYYTDLQFLFENVGPIQNKVRGEQGITLKKGSVRQTFIEKENKELPRMK